MQPTGIVKVVSYILATDENKNLVQIKVPAISGSQIWSALGTLK